MCAMRQISIGVAFNRPFIMKNDVFNVPSIPSLIAVPQVDQRIHVRPTMGPRLDNLISILPPRTPAFFGSSKIPAGPIHEPLDANSQTP